MLKQKLSRGEKIFGAMLRISTNPAVCRIAKNSGLDYVMYDCEHAAYSMETLHNLFLAGNAMGLEGFLRVPSLEKQYISRALDQGARGVMVPKLETPEMAREFVRLSKYEPVGERGFSTNLPHTDYAVTGSFGEIMENANNAVISIAQIETKLAVDNVDAIAATEGIDALLVGPNDLSISLGIPGDLFHPAELEAISAVAAACKKHGKAFGLHAGKKLLQKFEDDVSIIMVQTDVNLLAAGFESIKHILD